MILRSNNSQSTKGCSISQEFKLWIVRRLFKMTKDEPNAVFARHLRCDLYVVDVGWLLLGWNYQTSQFLFWKTVRGYPCFSSLLVPPFVDGIQGRFSICYWHLTNKRKMHGYPPIENIGFAGRVEWICLHRSLDQVYINFVSNQNTTDHCLK